MLAPWKYVAAALLVMPVAAQARVEYEIDLTSPEHHLAQVSAIFPKTDAPYLDVKMPAWRPGR
jgi:M61 glycyl aminopeptidase